MTDEAKEIQNRVAKAISLCGGTVPKDARNAYHDFQYASKDAVLLHCRNAVAEAGLCVWQSEKKKRTFSGGESQQGKPKVFMEITYEMGFSLDHNRPKDVEIISAGDFLADPQTYAKIRAFGLKYWLIDKLLLATGDQDVDASNGEEVPAKNDKPKRQRQRGGRPPGGERKLQSEQPPAEAPKEITSTKWMFKPESYEFGIFDQDGEDCTTRIDVTLDFIRSLYSILSKPGKIAQGFGDEVSIEQIIDPLFEANLAWIKQFPEKGVAQIVQLWRTHGNEERLVQSGLVPPEGDAE